MKEQGDPLAAASDEAADELSSVRGITPAGSALSLDGDLGLEFEADDAAPTACIAGAMSTSVHDEPKLSDEELSLVMGWPTPSSPWNDVTGPLPRNRRDAARHPISTRALVRVTSAAEASAEDAEETRTVQLRNLSVGGVSALHAHPLRPGDAFRITLRGPDTRAASLARTVERRCTVLRCEPGGTGSAMFSIAAQFVA